MFRSKYCVLIILIIIKCCVCEKYQSPRPHNPSKPIVYPPDFCQQLKPDDKFDYVVIGAGPAGATVARRLAENVQEKVLLVEAGDDPDPASDFFLPAINPSAVWNYKTEPSDDQCAGYPNKQCSYTLAKVLGGCSIINAELYIRGNHKDYDEWEARGNPGWGWKDMFPYFLKLENYNDPHNLTSPDQQYHSAQGPFTTSPFPLDPYTADLRTHLISSIEHLNLPLNNDINGKSQIGFGTITGSVEETGYRNNVAKSYLQDIPDNLKVCKNSAVSKLLISSEKTVEGADATYCASPGDCKPVTLKAMKEFILAAGPANTPLILERSGIGDKLVLEEAGVEVIHELKGVGNNLQDHFGNLGCAFELDLNNAVARNPLTNSLSSFVGFLNMTDYSHQVPDVQFIFVPFVASEAFVPNFGKEYNAKRDILIISSVVLRQTTSGYIHITDKNPNGNPKFNPNQFSSKEEARLTTEACKLAREIMGTPKMAKFNAKPIVMEKCKSHEFNTEDEVICGAKLLPLLTYHLAGTAAMGPSSDNMAVVDSRLKVHGINKLRIVDLSVMPQVPRGNTEIPTIAVAERAADIIKEDAKFEILKN